VSPVIALDVALLLPPDVQRRAIALSAALPASESKGLRLDANHLPHVTLTQQFVRRSELEQVFARIDEVVRERRAIPLMVTGGGRGTASVWMALAVTPELQDLHERLMEELAEFQESFGIPDSFVDGDARTEDLRWVDTYRRASAFASYTPHVTLGHASLAPVVESFEFSAAIVAACHLGRFCTCRHVLAEWRLEPKLPRR